MSRTGEPGRSVSSRLLEILFAFEPDHLSLSLVELVEATGMPRATVRRLALELVEAGALAHSPVVEIETLLGRGLVAYTSATITDPDLLRRELAACRSSGTAVVRGERTEDADSYAARIIDASGWVVGALSVVVRAGTVKEYAALPAVLTSALNISRMLGWRPGVRVH